MKICIVSHYYPPHVGGLEVVAQQVATALARAGHSVEVVTASDAQNAGHTEEDSVIVVRIPANNLFEKRFKIPFPIFVSGIATIFRSVKKADIVHLHDVFYLTSWVACLASRFYQKPLVLTQHVALVDHPSQLVTFVQRVVYATWGRLIFFVARRIMVYNAIVRNFLLARGVPAAKIAGVRNGVDLSLFHAAAEEKSAARERFGLPDRPLALFVGRFVPKKGIAEFLAAKRDSFDLVLAGSGDLAPQKGIHVLGALDRTELAGLYRAADVCVIPSKGELFTLTLQEAAASGLPIITSNEPEYAQEGLDTTRIMLVERNGTVIAEAIEKIISDDALKESMREYSLALAKERFDEGKNLDEIIRIFEHLRDVRVVTSWDDGHQIDFKVAGLLKKYGVPGIFYVSPEDRELPESVRLTKEDVRELAKDFEIGAHTMTHPYLPVVSIDEAEKEIRRSKKVLEEWTGKPILSFCYPKGGYTQEIEKIVERAGFSNARTVERFALDEGSDPYAQPTSIHTYDHWSDIWPVLKLARFNPLRFFHLYHRWDEQAKALFDKAKKEGGTFHLWGHSWELEQNGDWERFENVLRYISHPGLGN